MPRRPSTTAGASIRETASRATPARWAGAYLGGAGIVDALRRLTERGLVELRRDYLPYLEQLAPDMPGPSLMLGETGILLVRHRLSPSGRDDRAAARRSSPPTWATRNARSCSGAPARCSSPASSASTTSGAQSADRLLEARDAETGLWTQCIWGKTDSYLGAAHGFAGCVLALGDFEGAAETARRYAMIEEGLANWPPHPDGSSATGRSASSGATVRRE